jgi:TonB family protein
MGTPLAFKIYMGETLVGTPEFNQDIIKIGRLATAHLKLEDPRVSRIHAVVEVAGGGQDVFVTDMGSADGTFVNGEKVNKVKLKDGDAIVVGDTKLLVVFGGLAAAGLGAVSTSAATDSMAAVRSELQPVAGAGDGSGVFSRGNLDDELLGGFQPVTPLKPNVIMGQPKPAPAVTVPRLALATAQPAAVPARVPQAAPAPAPAVAEDAPPYGYAAPAEEDAYQDDEEEGPWETEPEPVPDASRAVLELQVRWGQMLVEVQHHDHTPLVTIGPAGTVQIAADEFPPPARPLFSCTGTQYSVHLADEFTGFIRTAGEGIQPLADVDGVPEGGSKRIVLNPDQSGELRYHDMVLAFRFNEKRPPVLAAPMGSIDYMWLNTFMTTVFMSCAFVATLMLYPQDTKSLEEDVFQTNNRFTQLIINPEKKKKNEFLEKLQEAKKKPDKEPPSSAANKKPDSKKPDPAPNTKAKPVETREQKRARDRAVVENKIAALFGGDAAAGVFATASAQTLETAMGGISSREMALSGFGGLDARGAGPGAVGAAFGTFGVGKIGTRGRGGGNAGFGSGTGGLGGKTDRSIDIGTGAPVILGSLDKEIIRRVIRDNIAQVRYCYEKELVREPGLAGKVGVKFVIGAQGMVQTAQVAETSLNNKNVESCVLTRVKSWVFPKPKGGGIVIVTYPFIFKQSG